MASPDIRKDFKEKPFEGKKVYFCNSISGVLNVPPNFGWELVRFMKDGGAEVLDEFVGARNENELVEIFLRDFSFDRRNAPHPWIFVRRLDISLVDEATHLVAIIDGPSHGVGMEIQRAIDKPLMGKNPTKILCLLNEKLFESGKPTWLIKGVTEEECPGFTIAAYKDLEDAKQKVFDFLISK